MRRGESGPRAFQAPVDVHASADGQVYMFKSRQDQSAVSSDEEEDDEEEEVSGMEMRTRAPLDQDRPLNVELLEKEVLDGDNLNNLALKYGCKVADLKRVNNLMHEQDLFALKSIKIPVQKHSFLMEEFLDVHEEASPAVRGHPSGRARSQQHLPEVTDFLMEVDNDIEKLIQDSGDHSFFSFSKEKQRFAKKAQGLMCPGADWGIHWWNAVIAMFLIVIVLPLFYVIYFKTKSSEEALAGHTLQPASASNSTGKDV
ncbi:lysM and putative peptidoglycan-binding domain-containing protein 4 [Synchiropus splendidus]|uniref:lysM and putative peptidoglycan-binding domain-containing protein 4 n=1 Tax=Synchiropus splendidus TaxID=270530 RepID=UPI00237DA815|nr:lysM and putative peptidoglycan-binding domain-containing protein 4 [Synchiropus splendidus]